MPAPAAKRPNSIKPAAAAVHNRDDRAAGLMLNDAQIASIKTRLHLTPDQEQMWPAVEAALRNIAYTRSREAHRQGTTANTQVASADGVDVRELKSAAVPLIMSFNSEQKDEVRNLAHVMGLDQLATQF
jgi:zinc resistance-associated protein